jgi:uncharacterized phiE125 gp8 family phage protein
VAAYTLITPPSSEPVSTAFAKWWMKLDAGDTSDDGIVSALISAARELVETFTGRALVTQTWTMTMDAFPGYVDRRSVAAEAIKSIGTGVWYWEGSRWAFSIPFPPVQSVASVVYNDGNGNPQTLNAGTDYVADTISSPARIMPVFGSFWPLSQYAPNAVTVTFVCGYGVPFFDPETGRTVNWSGQPVPQSIIIAILMLVSYWYNNRDAVTLGGSAPQELPMGVKAMLWQYRDLRF